MKLLITTHENTIELNLYDIEHYAKVIEIFHKNKGLNQKDIYNMLVSEYENNKCHDYQYIIRKYKNNYNEFLEHNPIFNFVSCVYSYEPNFVYKKIMEIIKVDDNYEYLRLFLLLSYTNFCLNKDNAKFADLLVFADKNKEYVLDMLTSAHDNGLFKRSPTVKDVLFKRDVKDDTLDFIKKAFEDNGEKNNYISFSNPDYSNNNSEYLLKTYFNEIVTERHKKNMLIELSNADNLKDYANTSISEIIEEILDDEDFCYLEFSIQKVLENKEKMHYIRKEDLFELIIK